jgi:hypothetical protein
MSRSRKKHAIGSITTAKSEKFDKRVMNRNLRHKVKQVFRTSSIDKLEEYIEPSKDEIMDIWNMQKDGKCDWTGTEWEIKARRK